MLALKIDKHILFGTDYMQVGLAPLILPPKLIQNRYAKLAHSNDLTVFRLPNLYLTFFSLQGYYCWVIFEHLSSPPVFSGVRVTRSLVLCVFCRSLFVLMYFFFWSLCCLFFLDIRILIAPLLSSNSSLIILIASTF